MLIESIIQRPKGTKVSLRSNYHFLPDAEGRHVAEVEDQSDIATLLAIREGFRAADGSVLAGVANIPELDGFFFIIRGPQDRAAFADWIAAIPEMAQEPLEMTLLIDKIAVGEASLDGYPLPPREFIPPATWSGAPPVPEHSLPAPADNSIRPIDQTQPSSPGSDTGGSQGAGEGGAGAAGGTGSDTFEEEEEELEDDPPGELDREALAMEYDEIVGHRPNGKWSPEKIAAAIAELKAKG